MYVDVLTTCSGSALDDWSRNRFSPGAVTHGRLTVRRFRVDARNRRVFEHVNAMLLALKPEELKTSVSPIGADNEVHFVRNNIGSRDMDEYLRKYGRRYDSVVFLPYLYGTTLRGLPLVAERAYLQPCLHDEAYAYLTCVEQTFRSARGVLFNSSGEFELALKRFGPGIIPKSRIVGEGVDIATDGGAARDRFGGIAPTRDRFLLYLGRQDVSKNLYTLVSAFESFRRRRPTSRLKLVLAGERSARPFGDPSAGIIDLGPVTEAEKVALLANCRALAQPSLNESYSRVMVEAWLNARPVVVNSGCLTTSTAVVESGGGYCAGTAPEWERTIAKIDDADDQTLDELGVRGNAYAKIHGTWDSVLERYREALGSNVPTRPSTVLRQSIPSDDSEIAIYAESLTGALESIGIAAPVDDAGRSVPAEVADDTIRHVRGGETALADFESSRGQIVIYHPDRHTAAVRLGRVPEPSHRVVFGSTLKAVAELHDAGLRDAHHLPLYVDPKRWDRRPDEHLVAALQDRKTNLLYVGPFRELGAIDELLTMFLHYLSLDLEARLSIIATGLIDESVFDRVFAEVRTLDLIDNVLVAADLSEGQMQALYQTADVFISLDENDPPPEDLLRAMWFDVPVIAYKTPTVDELVAPSGLVLTDKSDPISIAALAQMVVHDRTLRERIVKAQRNVRSRFGPERIATIFAQCRGVHA